MVGNGKTHLYTHSIFKVLILNYKVLDGLDPGYLRGHLSSCIVPGQLQSETLQLIALQFRSSQTVIHMLPEVHKLIGSGTPKYHSISIAACTTVLQKMPKEHNAPAA